MANPVAFVLKGYPRLSETFIAQEIHALEKRDINIHLYSLRQPTEKIYHPIHDLIKAEVNYLPEYLKHEPLRVARAYYALKNTAGYKLALRTWLNDFKRDRTRNRIRRFGQALVLAHELPREIKHLHAHFIHTPASVARYAAKLCGLTWSCSAHAKDIWTSQQWELSDKLNDCSWAVTCTKNNVEHLSSIAPNSQIDLTYHGLDLRRFEPPKNAGSKRDGSNESDPVIILSVGRAVEKKGYDNLLGALACLPKQLHWRFEHIGGGLMQNELKNIARKLEISQYCNFHGPQSHDFVLSAYREADLFALMCKKAKNGDQDGLPNVILEAQSQCLPVLSSDTSAIPEILINDVNGLVVKPNDIKTVTDSLILLIEDASLRSRLGQAGKDIIHRKFSLEPCIESLAERFNVL